MDSDKNKLISNDNKKVGENPTNRGDLTPNINGHSILPENAKISSSENQIQSEFKKEKIILVADDDDFNFFIIESLLTPYNYRVIHARNGEEAVLIFRTKEISLILMDIQMPVMDGITATKEIRKIDKKIPVIVQTSYTIDKIKEMAISSGCNDFITKPLDSDLLIHKIETYINN